MTPQTDEDCRKKSIFWLLKSCYYQILIIASSFLANAAFAADGFAESVTGGEGGTILTATNAPTFKTFVEAVGTYIVEVSGTIDLEFETQHVHFNARGMGEGVINSSLELFRHDIRKSID